MEDPAAAIEELIADNADHPYALVGLQAVEEAVRWLVDVTASAGYPFTGSIDRNFLLPAGLGAARPTCLAPETMVAGDLRRDDPMLVVGIEGFADLVREIATANSPYVGVCFGHQMIAHALGGRVEKADAGWGLGIKQVSVPAPPPWLPASSFRILNSHADQISSLPAGAVPLGGNRHCPVSLMAMGDDMIGLQGHPEFVPAYVEALARRRRGKAIPPVVADEALESLGRPPDTELLAGAIVAFLRPRVGAARP